MFPATERKSVPTLRKVDSRETPFESFLSLLLAAETDELPHRCDPSEISVSLIQRSEREGMLESRTVHNIFVSCTIKLRS